MSSPVYISISISSAHSPNFDISPTSQLILRPFRRFTYVTAHSPTLPLLHLRHNSFSKPSFASPTSQALHLIQLASRPSISGVQNLTLYCKIDTVILLFRWVYKWSLAQGPSKTLDPLFLQPIEPEIWTLEKSGFATKPFGNNCNADCCARTDIKRSHISSESCK